MRCGRISVRDFMYLVIVAILMIFAIGGESVATAQVNNIWSTFYIQCSQNI